MAFANCIGADTNLFFTDTKHTRKVERIKKRYCRPCAVREECYNYAKSTQSVGIFGSATEEERERRSLFEGILSLSASRGTPVTIRSSLNSALPVFSSLSNTLHVQQHPNGEHFPPPSYMSSQDTHNRLALSKAAVELMESLSTLTQVPEPQLPLELSSGSSRILLVLPRSA